MATPSTPPAVVTIGDLYVDAQTRALWLGVDVSVNPAGSIIISDYNYMLALISEGDAAVTAYVNAQVATRAALSHTHVASQITDFAAAVAALAAGGGTASVPPGGIILWSGSLASIGVGALVGWALCDGLNGTPDLRDRFVMGAGNVAAGSLNPSATAATSSAGGHTPVIQGTSLTIAQLPAHVHAGPSHTHSSGTLGGSALSAGTHTHTAAGDDALTRTPSSNLAGSAAAAGTQTTSSAGAHTHTVDITTGATAAGGTGSTSSVGTGTTHTHLANTVADHTHTVTSANLRAALPYYALAYIMKLA